MGVGSGHIASNIWMWKRCAGHCGTIRHVNSIDLVSVGRPAPRVKSDRSRPCLAAGLQGKLAHGRLSVA